MAKRPRKPKVPEPVIDPQLAPRRRFAFRLIAVSVCAAAVGAGCPYGLAWLRAAAMRIPASRVDVSEVRLTPAPGGIRGDLVRSALRHAGIAEDSLSLADATLPRRLSEAFEKSPWIESARVRRTAGRFEVAVLYRRPVLSLPWWPRLACYVAADGVVLPVPREVTPEAPLDPVAEQESLRRCLALEGMSEDRVPAVGATIDDPRITAAARFASLLRDAREKLDLVRVVVASPRDKPFACDLGTLRGSIIRWGVVEGPEKSQQIERRLATLFARADRRYRLDPPDGPFVYEFNSAGDAVSTRPLAARTASFK